MFYILNHDVLFDIDFYIIKKVEHILTTIKLWIVFCYMFIRYNIFYPEKHKRSLWSYVMSGDILNYIDNVIENSLIIEKIENRCWNVYYFIKDKCYIPKHLLSFENLCNHIKGELYLRWYYKKGYGRHYNLEELL